MPTLRVVPGGKGRAPSDSRTQGPITRLGLWEQFKPLSKKHLAMIFVPKLLLLSVVLYCLFTMVP